MPHKPVFNLEDWMKNISKFSMCFSMCNFSLRLSSSSSSSSSLGTESFLFLDTFRVSNEDPAGFISLLTSPSLIALDHKLRF
eukprot:jgi/Psemu1/21276/gm1.21276_g